MESSAYVNGNLWTYNTIYDNQDSPTVKATTVTEPVDPLVLAEPLASLIPGFSFTVYGLGSFATGLTRDDVGDSGTCTGPTTRTSRPSRPTPRVAPGSAGPWVGAVNRTAELRPPSTNGTAGGGTTNAASFYGQAMRGGVDKVTFLRGPAVYQPGAYATNRYTESVLAVITNGVQRTISTRHPGVDRSGHSLRGGRLGLDRHVVQPGGSHRGGNQQRCDQREFHVGRTGPVRRAFDPDREQGGTAYHQHEAIVHLSAGHAEHLSLGIVRRYHE